ncbi:MAG: hypothetical protein K6G15_03725 [Desulfovibrio sp.]|nr:hypothetical protein [Desulfovibrio sp.]
MNRHLCFSLIALLLVQVLLLAKTTKALGESLLLREQMSIPQGLPAIVAPNALRARIWLDGVKKLQKTLPSQRDINLHFEQANLPALVLLLNATSVTLEQGGGATVTATFSAKATQTLQELLTRMFCADLVEAAAHFVLETEKTLQRMDRHWPNGRLYTESLFPSPQEEPDGAWTETDWLCSAKRLEGLWLGIQALHSTSGDWLTQPQALASLENAVSWQAADPYLLSLLAEARLMRDLPQQCVETATQALHYQPELRRARYLRALAHWQLQQFGLAENDLSVILQSVEPAKKLPYLRARGAVRLLLGRFPGMCQDFTEACSFGDCDGLKHARSLSHCLPH